MRRQTVLLNGLFAQYIAMIMIMITITSPIVRVGALSLPSTSIDSADYRRLLLRGAPMMDVRSPIEFSKGSVPSASNLPLLTDDERHVVGCTYRQQGEAAAIELGHSLVNGETKAARMRGWLDFCQSNPNDGGREGYLFCFRGGLRSRTVQRWIEEETGVRYPLVTGGYKAMRTFLIEEMERWGEDTEEGASSSLVVVCERTGSGLLL